MKVSTYNNLSTIEKINFYSFLESTHLESKSASINMWHNNWINEKHTLPFILNSTDIQTSGGVTTYSIIYKSTIPQDISGTVNEVGLYPQT